MKLTTTPSLEINRIAKSDRASVEAILRDLKGAHDAISRAGRKWVNLDGKLRRTVIEASPPALKTVWNRLDKVGLGSLHPQLVTATGLAARYLAKLPIVS